MHLFGMLKVYLVKFQVNMSGIIIINSYDKCVSWLYFHEHLYEITALSGFIHLLISLFSHLLHDWRTESTFYDRDHV
jgi:vacuolar-type H+-ATPase subunit I/STV1